jgi:cation:H+ antiporter
MNILLDTLLLIIGFVVLIKSADFFVDGASALAMKLNIPEIVIGLTIVAFGTSAPELFVNVFSALKGETDIALGNVIGSNIMNILLILGVAGIIKPLTCQKNTVWKEIPFSLLAALVLFIISNDFLIDGESSMVTRSDGIILLLFFVIFLTYTFGIDKASVEENPVLKPLSNFMLMVHIIAGFTGLGAGGNLVVSSATAIAETAGVSSRIIGLTVVAIGTSLPELVTSAIAAFKGKTELAIGNVVGSNVFNILLVLGLTSVISPVHVTGKVNVELSVLILASFLLFLTMFTGGRRTLDRWEAGVFLLLFLLYTLALIYF